MDFHLHTLYNVHVVKKRVTILLSISTTITSPIFNRFSKFFHHQTQEEICNKAIIKNSTTPQMRRYTLWNMNVEN